MKRFATAALSALALISCATTEAKQPPAAAKPALWKVADADTTVYLFGTIHLLPKGEAWTTPKLAAAMDGSEALVLETVMPKDPAVMGATMAKLAVSPGLPPVLDRVPADKRAALQAVIAKSKIPAGALDRLETWAVALALTAQLTQGLGLSTEEGAEAQLTTRFAKANRPVSGLETPEQQLGYFDALPESVQRQFLVSVAEDDAKAKVQLEEMIAAWRAGDLRAIARSFNDEMERFPELEEALLTHRNANWTNWIAARMAQPGTVFVAVGAGHLAGPGSVDAMLKKRGLRVTRVQ